MEFFIKAFAVLISVALNLGGLIMLLVAGKSKNWVSTFAEIIHTEIKNVGGSSNTWKPIVTYKYQIDGKSYTGNKISIFSGAYILPNHAQRALNSYQKGRRVRVYYHPQNHSKSVLKPGVRGSLVSILGMFIGGIMILGFIPLLTY